jgi:hypothetical protein
MAGVTPRHCATRSRPSSTPRPSKGFGDTLRGRTTADLAIAQDGVVTQGERSTSPPSPPALCYHRGRCEAIPGAVGACSNGTPPRRPLCSPNSPISRPSNRCMNNNQTRAPAKPPSKPPPDKHMGCHDAHKNRGPPGPPSNRKHYTPGSGYRTKSHATRL